VKMWIAVVLAGLVSFSAHAQESDMQSLPGYVDFGALDSVYGEPRVRISIGGSLLKFMAAVSRDEPEAAELMRNLEGVRVNVYSTAGKTDAAVEQITRVKKVLMNEAWEPIVQVQEQNEDVQIFVKVEEDRMQGLTVMTVNEEEAVFINILGEMDPAQLAAVMSQLHVDVDVEVEEQP
jgi:hypothetical protein